MIKNIIIVFLLVFVITQTDVTFTQVVNYAQSTVDKVQELIYYVRENV